METRYQPVTGGEGNASRHPVIKLALVCGKPCPISEPRVQHLTRHAPFESKAFYVWKNPGVWNVLNQLGLAFFSLWRWRPRAQILFSVGSLQALLAAFTPGQNILWFWGGDVLARQGAMQTPWDRWIKKKIIRKAHRILCVSREVQREITSHFEGNEKKKIRKKCRLQACGIDTNFWSCESRKHRNHRKTIRFYSPRWCLPEYQILLISRALAQSRYKRRLKLIWQTEDWPGSRASQNYRKQILRQAEIDGFKRQLIPVRKIAPSRRKKIMQSCDYVISVPPSDGLPLSLLEAMAMGKVVLSNGAGGGKELIRNGQTGFILRGSQPEQLASEIDAILEKSIKLKRKIGNRARCFARKFACLKKEQQMVEKSIQEI